MTHTQSISLKGWLARAFFVALGFFFIPSFADAQITLSPTPEQVVNGGTVRLDWTINSNVTDCSISDGVSEVVSSAEIATSPLPATGFKENIPVPNDAVIEYTMTCVGGGATVVVPVKPVIDIDETGDNPVVIDATYNEADVEIRWETRFATHCSKVWRERVSNLGEYLPTADTDNPQAGQRDGTVDFFLTSQAAITESTYFHIECWNTVTGAVATNSVLVNVLEPGPLSPPSLTVWSGNAIGPNGIPAVYPDALYGWATANFQWEAYNVNRCSFELLDANGVAYPTNLSGWGWTETTFSANRNVSIPATTTMRATCERDEVTYGGTFYPATSTSAEVTVEVIRPSDFDAQRAALAPVITVLDIAPSYPSVAPIDPYSGNASTRLLLQASNGDQCYPTAEREYDGVQFTATGWTGWYPGNSDTYRSVIVGTSTRFIARCVRTFDLYNYGPGDPQWNNASSTDDVVFTTYESAAGLSPVTNYMYGNGALYINADQMRNRTISQSNWNTVYTNANGERVLDGNWAVSTSTISFEFQHPTGGSDVYDVFVRYCDEGDGVADFTLSTADGGLNEAWTTDRIGLNNACDGTAVLNKLLATGVTMDDGEVIDVQCVNHTPANETGEKCRILGLAFGIDTGGVLNVTPDANGYATATAMWVSENSDRCINELQDPPGIPFVNTTRTIAIETTDISTTTSFSVTCQRDLDGASRFGEFYHLFPDAGGPVVSTTTIASGQCIDQIDGSANDILPDAPSRSYQPGERDNPITGFCEFSIDLAAKDPSMNPAGGNYNAITGIYNSLEARLVIENLGDGVLPAGDPVPYLARMILNGPIANAFGFSAPYEIDEGPDNFTGGIATATPPAVTESNTLTKVFNGIPFGTHTLISRVNLDGGPDDIYPEGDLVKTNNQSNPISIPLPVLQPPMSINASTDLIRRGESVLLDWMAHTAFNFNCEVSGPGGISDVFNSADSYPSAYTQTNVATGALESKSEFTLTCTEPLTGTTFIESVVVEVEPMTTEI